MSTVLYPSPVFGPIHSRRLGISLGINLLPANGKVCSFDCLYCECGFNSCRRPSAPMPSRQEVAQALEKRLQQMAGDGELPDVLTFAGNGEPTLNPRFPQIVDDVIALRDSYCPNAKVSILSNATQTPRQEVFDALLRVDNNIQKLDTVDPAYIDMVNRPTGHYNVRDIIERLRAFHGHVIIQTMFMGGSVNGNNVDNTAERFVAPWIDALSYIAPQQVMIYTIDRKTPADGLRKTSPQCLDSIRQRVLETGIPCSAAY